MSSLVLVNLGCGQVWHAAWRNFDLDPQHSSVDVLDLTQPIPLPDASADAVYHAHVLEHLAPDAGTALLAECRRILKPGACMRVVVPDLAELATRYVSSLDDGNDLEHEWATLELLDQLVRTRREGALGDFLRTQPWRDHSRIRSRVGTEIGAAVASGVSAAVRQHYRRPARRWARWRFAWARLLLTARERTCLDEAQFRVTGELHRWMYDRRSLSRALLATGFAAPAVCRADTSRIPNFTTYELDVTSEGHPRHPDSLYMEALRP